MVFFNFIPKTHTSRDGNTVKSSFLNVRKESGKTYSGVSVSPWRCKSELTGNGDKDISGENHFGGSGHL